MDHQICMKPAHAGLGDRSDRDVFHRRSDIKIIVIFGVDIRKMFKALSVSTSYTVLHMVIHCESTSVTIMDVPCANS